MELLYLVIMIAGLVLSVVWLVFPFIVSSRLDELNRQAACQTALLEKIARQTSNEEQTPAPAHNPLTEPPSYAGRIAIIILSVVVVGMIVIAMLKR
jgi:hypothetical protein